MIAFVTVKQLNPAATVLYQGPEGSLVDTLLPVGNADDDYFLCIVVAVSDLHMAQTYTAARVQVN